MTQGVVRCKGLDKALPDIYATGDLSWPCATATMRLDQHATIHSSVVRVERMAAF